MHVTCCNRTNEGSHAPRPQREEDEYVSSSIAEPDRTLTLFSVGRVRIVEHKDVTIENGLNRRLGQPVLCAFGPVAFVLLEAVDDCSRP